MTQDEIIRMAREAGIGALTEYGKEALERFAAIVAYHEKKFWMEQIEVECNEAVLAEREACAKVCEEGEFMTFGCAAAAIRERSANARARGEK